MLNHFSFLSYRPFSFRTVATVGAVLLALAFALCLYMASKVQKSVVTTIDSIEFHDLKSISIGEHSDVCYSNVPQRFLIVEPTDEGFAWHVNEQYHDSLQYFKINNENPNRHEIRNSADQKLTTTLRNSHAEATFSLSGADIWEYCKRFDDQKDIPLHLFAPEGKQLGIGSSASFIHIADGSIALVILDERTQLTENGTTVSYTRSGTASADGDKKGHCKVQFFNVSELTTLIDDSVRHFLRTSVKLTEWGAGHVMLSKQGVQGDEETASSILVNFPKPITFVASADSLRKVSQPSSQTITLKQNNNAFPSKSDIFLPAFSNAINFDVCNLEFFHQDDSIVLRDNAQHAYAITAPSWPLFPRVGGEPLLLQSGKHVLHSRAGFIGFSFYLSYLALPAIVTLLLLLLVWSPLSPVKIKNSTRTKKKGGWKWPAFLGIGKPMPKNLYNSRLLEHYPTYLTLIVLGAFVFSACKSLIALKLSYTYPYFEKITAITPTATATAILLFFSLAMLFNSPLRHVAGQRFKLLASWLLCCLLTIGLVYTFFFAIDPQNSQHAIDSYFRSEVYSILPWEWLSQYGINDTHRSVPYALFFAEAFVLVAWLVVDVFWGVFNPVRKGTVTVQRVASPMEKLNQQWQQWADTFNGWVVGLWQKLFPKKATSPNKPASPKKSKWKIINGLRELGLVIVSSVKTALHALSPGHLLLLAALAFIGSQFGNFGTAFISLIVILGLTRALSKVYEYTPNDASGSMVRFCSMLLISMAYIGAAIVGDNGYMTNYLGFAMCLVTFFFLIDRPRAFVGNLQKAARAEKRNIRIAIIFLTAIVVALPFVSSWVINTDKVNYARLARRVMLYSSFNDLQRNGYRYSESDAEFMVIMSHYMQNHEGGNPLSNDTHFLHPSISAGQSPVVLNDLSMPAAFFGAYGIVPTTVVFFVMLLFLAWLVMQFSIGFVDTSRPLLTKAMQWRLLAVFMWIGTSFYIYLSYIDQLPFTGRLIPGYGVDAVGEALESAILLAFMATVSCRQKNVEYNNSETQ